MIGGTGSDAREGIQRADSAMYEAKRAGGDRMVFYRGSHRVREGAGWRSPADLRGAELRGELELVFQPVFELGTGKIAAVEALLRWDSPALGEVSPTELIPVAEDTGTIVPIDLGAPRELRDRRTDRPPHRGELELSVNVSAHQIAHRGSRGRFGSRSPTPSSPPNSSARDNRDRPDRLRRGDRAHAARARVPRHPDRARRLRHRGLVAPGSRSSGGRAQDRPRLHPRARRRHPRSGDRVLAVGMSRALGCTVTARALRPTSSSTRYARSTASAFRASCSPGRFRRRNSRGCSSATTSSLFGRQQPPIGPV